MKIFQEKNGVESMTYNHHVFPKAHSCEEIHMEKIRKKCVINTAYQYI